MDKPFRLLLKEHRLKQGLTKVTLAKAINKTDAYIRKIEDYGYTPPTFNVCNAMTQILQLSVSDRYRFLKQAFIERIRDDIVFLNEIETPPPCYPSHPHPQ